MGCSGSNSRGMCLASMPDWLPQQEQQALRAPERHKLIGTCTAGGSQHLPATDCICLLRTRPSLHGVRLRGVCITSFLDYRGVHVQLPRLHVQV